MIFSKPPVGYPIGYLTVRQNGSIVQVVDALQNVNQHAYRSILLVRDGRVMVTDQLNSDRYFAQVRLTIPHAAPGVIGHIGLVHDAIRATVAGNDIMGMTAIGASTVAEKFSFGDNSQRRFKSEFRGVDNNVVSIFASDFFESGIQPRAEIDDGALKRHRGLMGE